MEGQALLWEEGWDSAHTHLFQECADGHGWTEVLSGLLEKVIRYVG